MDALLIAGAGSLVGGYLQELVDPQGSVVLISRHQPAYLQPQFKWQALDLAREGLNGLRANSVIHLAPLPLITRHIASFPNMGVKRLVAVGTTSRFTKMHSNSPADQKVAQDQARAESEISEHCERQGVAWTVLRPTMV
ncbi:MAG: hypothetical protein ACRER7_07655, partial [Gammaproteobacteria bacterium]